MVTVKESEQVRNDITKFIAGMSPHANPNVEWLKTTTANIKPGMSIIRTAGAVGEVGATEGGNDSAMIYAIAEYDPKQIDNNGIAYAINKVIPVLPLHKNLGLVCRNIQIADPPADIDIDTPLCPEASGLWGVAAEATLIAESGTGGEVFDAEATSGKNGTTGATIHNRVYLRADQFLTDPTKDSVIVARIVAC